MLEVTVRGSNYEMGYQHGLLLRDDIIRLAQLRLGSCQEPYWTGKTLPFEEIIALADACIPYHRNYAPHLLDEWQGIADTTGLLLAEVLIVNGFTDFADVIYNSSPSVERRMLPECTAFMVSASHSSTATPFIGQNWDLHQRLTPYVILLRGYPKDAPAFMTFTLAGCIGMAGMNEHGIAVCITNLADCNGRPGVMWNMVVRKVLAQDNLDDALQVVQSAPIAGAHNYLLMDDTGRGYNLESMTGATYITPLANTLAHTNHCLHPTTRNYEQLLNEQDSMDTHTRLRRATQLMKTGMVTLDDLQALTRNREDGTHSICAISTPDWDVETCGSVIMSPATGELWALRGVPTEHEFVRYTL